MNVFHYILQIHTYTLLILCIYILLNLTIKIKFFCQNSIKIIKNKFQKRIYVSHENIIRTTL